MKKILNGLYTPRWTKSWQDFVNNGPKIKAIAHRGKIRDTARAFG